MNRYGITSDAGRTIHEIDPKVRKSGNELIIQAIKMEQKDHPVLAECVVYSKHVYNEYDNVQRTFHFAEAAVKKLIKWRHDGDPLTWKWHLPFPMEKTDGGEMMLSEPMCADWLTKAYKGYSAIALMQPARLIGLCTPEYFIYGRDDPRQRIVCNPDHIRPHQTHMEEGNVTGGQYCTVNKDMQVSIIDTYLTVCMALAAMRAGIREMPIYVESDRKWTDEERIMLASGDTSSLWGKMQ